MEVGTADSHFHLLIYKNSAEAKFFLLSSDNLTELFALYIFLAITRVMKPSGNAEKDGGGLAGLADAP
jgi:hypothetical protein